MPYTCPKTLGFNHPDAYHLGRIQTVSVDEPALHL